MIERIKPISNIYAVRQFHNIFRVYFIILTPVLVVTFFLGLVSMNSQIFESGILEPYRSSLLIAITISTIVFSPYFLYILFIEKKKKWILSFFIFVVIPFTLAYLIFQQFIFSMMGAFFPVLFYGIYCFLLKAEVQRWLSRYDWIQSRLEAEEEKKEIEIRGPF
jgi:hypothetical protein